ncbi:MAG: hypothetical protein FJ100_09290 [Deltaproteobacteria bacterium]|nr:hypothetical protein [Deltaproteobacteria bacterium]
MALSNRDRIQRGLDHVRVAVIPFVERELHAKLGPDWIEDVKAGRERALTVNPDGSVHWDAYGVLKTMMDRWHEVFRGTLGPAERSYTGELVDVRNRWAHDHTFTSDDTLRALDTMQRLCEAVGAAESAQEIGKLRNDTMRAVFDEQARNQTRYQGELQGMPSANLKPWREVATPHPDVASGNFMEAEFAADLAQVHAGKTVSLRIREAWTLVLVPTQPDPRAPIALATLRIAAPQGQAAQPLAERTAARLKTGEEYMVAALAPRVLIEYLDTHGLWHDPGHAALQELADWCGSFCYMPRLTAPMSVLEVTVSSGLGALLAEDKLAIAESWGAEANCYRGLALSAKPTLVLVPALLVVKYEAADAFPPPQDKPKTPPTRCPEPEPRDPPEPPEPPVVLPTRFFATVALDAVRPVPDLRDWKTISRSLSHQDGAASRTLGPRAGDPLSKQTGPRND